MLFTRSTLPTLAAIVLLAWGPRAAGEALDQQAAAATPTARQTKPLSAPRVEAAPLRHVEQDGIAAWQPPSGGQRAGVAAWSPDSAASGATNSRGRLSFDARPDDERAGSSASLTLG